MAKKSKQPPVLLKYFTLLSLSSALLTGCVSRSQQEHIPVDTQVAQIELPAGSSEVHALKKARALFDDGYILTDSQEELLVDKLRLFQSAFHDHNLRSDTISTVLTAYPKIREYKDAANILYNSLETALQHNDVSKLDQSALKALMEVHAEGYWLEDHIKKVDQKAGIAFQTPFFHAARLATLLEQVKQSELFSALPKQVQGQLETVYRESLELWGVGQRVAEQWNRDPNVFNG